MAKREENPFEDPTVAAQWIQSVENEKDLFRDKEIYPRLNKWVLRNSPKRLLEIGCGQGICASKIALGHSEYLGIEPSHALLKRAKELYAKEHIVFKEGNAYKLPISVGAFDAVFSVVVWLHLEDLSMAARELARVLTSKGKFLIVTANPQAYSSWQELFEAPIISGKTLEGRVKIPGNSLNKNIIFFHTELELLGSFREHGLSASITERFGSGIEKDGTDYFIAIEGTKSS